MTVNGSIFIYYYCKYLKFIYIVKKNNNNQIAVIDFAIYTFIRLFYHHLNIKMVMYLNISFNKDFLMFYNYTIKIPIQ